MCTKSTIESNKCTEKTLNALNFGSAHTAELCRLQIIENLQAVWVANVKSYMVTIKSLVGG